MNLQRFFPNILTALLGSNLSWRRKARLTLLCGAPELPPVVEPVSNLGSVLPVNHPCSMNSVFTSTPSSSTRIFEPPETRQHTDSGRCRNYTAEDYPGAAGLERLCWRFKKGRCLTQSRSGFLHCFLSLS